MKELIEVMKEEMQGINYKIQMDSEELKLAREQTLSLRRVINQKDEEILRCKQQTFEIQSAKKELELKLIKQGINLNDSTVQQQSIFSSRLQEMQQSHIKTTQEKQSQINSMKKEYEKMKKHVQDLESERDQLLVISSQLRRKLDKFGSGKNGDKEK